jgi:hypothetical protein
MAKSISQHPCARPLLIELSGQRFYRGGGGISKSDSAEGAQTAYEVRKSTPGLFYKIEKNGLSRKRILSILGASS